MLYYDMTKKEVCNGSTYNNERHKRLFPSVPILTLKWKEGLERGSQ